MKSQFYICYSNRSTSGSRGIYFYAINYYIYTCYILRHNVQKVQRVNLQMRNCGPFLRSVTSSHKKTQKK